MSIPYHLALHAPLFGAPSIHSGSVFATLGSGDATALRASTVAVPPNLFHCMAEFESHTGAALDAALAANPGAVQLALAAAREATETIRTQLGMFVPPRYVTPIMVASKAPGGLNPCQLWALLAPR